MQRAGNIAALPIVVPDHQPLYHPTLDDVSIAAGYCVEDPTTSKYWTRKQKHDKAIQHGNSGVMPLPIQEPTDPKEAWKIFEEELHRVPQEWFRVSAESILNDQLRRLLETGRSSQRLNIALACGIVSL